MRGPLDSQQSVERMEDAITEIVDALVNCRFVQTDKVQDQLIHFRLIQVCVFTYSIVTHNCWN